MSVSKNEIAFQFLSDSPEGEDGFAGKGHERSARALANAIFEFSNDDRSIGLEGAWGSGKTTVVSIAEGELEESHPGKFAFFTFDLWANQSVEFRRAFLEEFLGWSKSYMATSKFKFFEKRVQGKERTVETETERRFSVFGYVLMTSLFVLPFLVLWLSPYSANLRLNPKVAELPWTFQSLLEYGHRVAVIIIALVALCFIGQFCYLWWERKSFRGALDGSFSLFARTSEKDTVKQSIREGDPTQYEFRELFSDILSQVQTSERRVVFVFDNVDRLPADRIQGMWSEVRSVFSRDGSGDKTPNAVVTAVVPYDRIHVLSAFEGLNSEEIENLDEGVLVNSATSYVSEDVFRKTFSAVVTVAPPVTSDVESFFCDCFDGALSNRFDDKQKYRLFQIFDTHLSRTSTNPTPRQVKAFANDVGMLWYQWQGEISAEAIAIFVLHRARLEANPKSLQSPRTIDSRYRHFANSNDLDKELAALAYNVEPAVALEVLLERDIIDAFLRPEVDQLLALSASPGFKNQLDRVLSHRARGWGESSLHDFAMAVNNYSKLDLDESVKELCDQHFVNTIPKLKKIDLSDQRSFEEIFQLVSCMPEENFGRHMQEIVKWVNAAELSDPSSLNAGRAWIKFVGGFFQKGLALFGEDIVLAAAKRVRIPFQSPDFYVGVALDCDECSLRFADFQSSTTGKTGEIADALADFGQTNSKDFSYPWSELSYFLTNSDKTALLSKLVAKSQSETLDDDRQKHFSNLAIVAVEVRREKATKNSLSQAISDGTLPWHAYRANEEKNSACVADTLWLSAMAVGASDLPTLPAANKSPFGDLSKEYEWFRECYSGSVSSEALEILVSRLIDQRQVGWWMSAFAKAPAHVLFKNVLEALLANPDCGPVTFDTLLKCYEALSENFQEDHVREMVNRVGAKINSKAIEEIDLDTIPLRFIRDISNWGGQSWAALLAKVDSHLQNISRADWTEALGENNRNRGLLVARGANLKGSIPPNNLRLPLTELLTEIVCAEGAESQNIPDFRVFIFALSAASRRAVAADIFERITNRAVNHNGLVSAMSAIPELFNDMPLEERPETAAAKILIPLLEVDLSRAVDYVEKRSDVWAKCLKQVPEGIEGRLIEYFQGFESSDDEAVRSQAETLRKILKLTLPKRQKPDAEDQGASSKADDEPG